MKKISILMLLAVAVAGTSLTSCNKYEEGPGLSIRTAKQRITNTWEVEKYVDADGTETAGTADDATMTITKDGEFTVTDGSFSITGTWAFDDSKENITTTYSFGGSNISSTSKIVRLSMTELWLEDEDGDQVHYREK